MVIMKEDQVKHSNTLELCGYQRWTIKCEGTIEYPGGACVWYFSFFKLIMYLLSSGSQKNYIHIEKHRTEKIWKIGKQIWWTKTDVKFTPGQE